MQLTAHIIDDEFHGRESLKKLIEDYCPHVKIIHLSAHVNEAVENIRKQATDIIFLDIEMPQHNGFKLFEFADLSSSNVIFTTAYDEYALKAFKYSAVHYLLKPIAIDDLKDAVDRVSKKTIVPKEEKETYKVLQENISEVTTLTLPSRSGKIFLKINKIEFLNADNNYTKFYTTDGKIILVSKSMKEYNLLLDQPGFFKTHRSYIVNLNCIKEYVNGRTGTIITNNNFKIPLVERRKEAFFKRFSKE